MEQSLEAVLSEAGVDPALRSSLISDGWTISSFRGIVANSLEFNDTLYEELCAGNPLTLLQKAQIRSAWRSLRTQDSEVQQSGPSSGSAPVTTSPEGSWSESFPPKLNSNTVAKLKQKFLSNFPSEVLTQDTQQCQVVSIGASIAPKTGLQVAALEIPHVPCKVRRDDFDEGRKGSEA